MKKLDPSLREFQYPDFGFEDGLNNEGRISSVWVLLADHISAYPKYERLKNFIAEESRDKLEIIRKQLMDINKSQKDKTSNLGYSRPREIPHNNERLL